VLEFLHVVKDIVQKGLKKGYYREHNNLYARVKGKVLVSETIKKNLLKNRTLSTSCSYDAFGFNIPENRLIKMALLFVGKYMTRLKLSALNEHFKENLSYISPAFEAVHDDVSISEIKQLIFNPFYKEYKRGIELAKLILKRFGYNISNTQKSELVKVPPFWIDMSKLFELYVYSFLKAEYGPFLFFQFPGKGTHIDYLVNKEGNEAIIDAKYKPSYKRGYDIIDIRQLSAYSRDEIVLKKLGISAGDMQRTVSKCLIIYPDSASNLCLWKNNEEAISGFVNFFKRSVGLPVIA
jgi:5-methylcytosine-specific restriction enzyme subunit McrC